MRKDALPFLLTSLVAIASVLGAPSRSGAG
jgi:hypothetical protein